MHLPMCKSNYARIHIDPGIYILLQITLRRTCGHQHILQCNDNNDRKPTKLKGVREEEEERKNKPKQQNNIARAHKLTVFQMRSFGFLVCQKQMALGKTTFVAVVIDSPK